MENEDKPSEAVKCFEEVLSLDRQSAAARPEQLADTLEYLAMLRSVSDDLRAARQAAEECLQLRIGELGDDHWQVKLARCQMDEIDRLAKAPADLRRKRAELERSSVRLRQLGKTAEAIGLAEQLAAIDEKLLGREDPFCAARLRNLASLYSNQGNYARAETLMQRVLEIYKKTLGENQPAYAEGLNHLAGLYFAQEDYARAETLLRQAVEIRKTIVGENHPDYAASLQNLADAYNAQGDYAQAEPLLWQALEITRKVRGENHPDYAHGLGSLALLYHSLGNYARAEVLYKQDLEITKKAGGENQRDYAASLHNLACLYRDEGEYAQAEPLLRQALEITKNVLGENHSDYAASLCHLADVYQAVGKHAQAEILDKQALEITKKVRGENHADYAVRLYNLGVLYYNQGDYAQAQPLLRRALEIIKKVLGEKHPYYTASLSGLAGLYYVQGDYARAEALLRQALESERKILGENHPDYAASLNNLAALYHIQGDYARAESLYRQAAAIIRRQLGATAAVQSGLQQLAMQEKARRYLDSYLSLTAQSGQYVDGAYREMLAWKGSVLRRQREMRAAGASPELTPIFQQLQRVAAQLSQQVWAAPNPKQAAGWHEWAAPDPEQAAGWRERVAKLSAEEERLEAELSSRSAAYREVQHQVSLEELQAALPDNVVLVDFLEYCHYALVEKKTESKVPQEDRLLAFVVSRGRPVEMVPLGAMPSLDEAIHTWRATFGTSPQGAAAGRLLRQRIWTPLKGKLHGAKVVLVSLDGGVERLPLGALPGKQPGSYLIEEQAIALVAVPQLLPEILKEENRKRLPKNLLLVGNVDYDAEPGRTVPAAPLQPPHLLASREERGTFRPSAGNRRGNCRHRQTIPEAIRRRGDHGLAGRSGHQARLLCGGGPPSLHSCGNPWVFRPRKPSVGAGGEPPGT